MTTKLPRSFASWRNAYFALGLALVALIAIYHETAAATVASWSRDPLAHGYLVIPAVLYLAWERRGQLKSLRPTPDLRALPLLALLAFGWFLGNLTGTSVLQQICLLVMLVGIVWGVLGLRAARVLLFPMSFLLFAAPLGDRLVPALQDVAARLAVKMLELSNVPVLLQGHVISIPGGTWQVAEACSGINYLTSSLALGYFYAGTVYRYRVHRIAFITVAALLPLAANGLRVYTTILIASLGGTRIVEGMQHYLYGWLVFTIIMGLMFAICGRWPETEVEKLETPPRNTSMLAAPSAWSPVVVATLALMLVALAPLAAGTLWLPSAANEPPPRPRPPKLDRPWTLSEKDHYGWTPHFATPSAEFIQTYDSGNSRVKLYVAYYRDDQPGVKLATAANSLYDQPWWAADTSHSAVTQEDQSFEVRETRLEGPSSLVVWTWYWVDGTFTSNDYVAKLLLAKARLLRGGQGAAALAIATENRPGVDPRSILKDFVAHLSIGENPMPLSPR